MTRSNSRRAALVAICCFGIGATACTARVADLTLVSTRNIDLSDAKLDVRGGKRVTGEDCVYALLGLIPFGVANLENAVDDALAKGGGNIMVDQVTNIRSLYFILLSQTCFVVEGTVLQAPETK